MRRPSRAGLSLVLACCAGIPLAAQNLESIGKEKPLSVSGGFSFNQVFYSSTDAKARREPYSYMASGNLNLSLYGWTLPLTFTLSDRNASFSQPFNQYSLHPTWTWITAHVGYTSMSFSPYTVNGHNFLGGAIELAPEGKWKFSALYGRFLKAVEYDTASTAMSPAAYQRTGYGMKATYGTGRNFIDVILFRGADDAASAHIPDSLNITPEENLVFGVAGGKTILQDFALQAELATSALTKDTRAEKTSHPHPLARAGSLFEPRLSTAYYHALKASINYQHAAWLLGFGYERIDPGYRTLGAYYFNNDLENITVNGSAGLLDGKLSVVASTGIQRDNVGKTKVSTMRRMVGSLNMNYTPSQKLNVSISYSGFQSFTNIRSKFETLNQLTPFNNTDTLSFTRISRNASLSAMYNLAETKTRRTHLTLQFSWQDAAEEQGDVKQNSGTRFYNFNTACTMNFVPQQMKLALAINSTINAGPFVQTRMIGPTASLSRSFFDRKFRATLSSSYNETHSNGKKTNTVFNSRWNGVITIRTKHNIHFNAVIVKRITKNETNTPPVTRFTCTVGYSYAFGRG